VTFQYYVKGFTLNGVFTKSKNRRIQYPSTTDYSYTPTVRRGWTVEEKEQVRLRQDGKE
jgi:hypothetical protein